MSNISGGMLGPDPSSKEYVFTLPAPGTTPIPLFDAADDTGKFVKAILTHKDETLGKRVLAATDYYTATDIVDIFREVKTEAGKGARFQQIGEQAYKDALVGFPDRAKEEMYQNMAFMNDWGYYGKADLGWSHSVFPRSPLPLSIVSVPIHSLKWFRPLTTFVTSRSSTKSPPPGRNSSPRLAHGKILSSVAQRRLAATTISKHCLRIELEYK